MTTVPGFDIYGGRDPRDLPMYPLMAAAHYLHIPQMTLRRWTLGQQYMYKGKQREARPVIVLADADAEMMSFWNVFEAHVLDSLRQRPLISFQKVRVAVETLKARYPNVAHPLVTFPFATGGVDIFIEEYGKLINVSQAEQFAMRDCMVVYLNRVERDGQGLVSRLYPFISGPAQAAPRSVVMDPNVQFGRPVLVGSRVRTSVLASRHRAGDSIEVLAGDYGRSKEEIRAAVSYEQSTAA